MTDHVAQGHLVVTRQRKGSDGNGIVSAVITYQPGTSGTTIPTGAWSLTVPAVPAGQYLWTRTTITYSNGKESQSYSVSYQATDGIQGCITRTTEWAIGVEYHNDEALTSGMRFLDIVIVTTSATEFSIYECLKTHTSSSDITYTNTTYWLQMSKTTPIYTPLVLAENAILRFTQTNQLLVMQTDGKTVNAGLGGGDYPLWIGASTPEKATFRIKSDGSSRQKGTIQLSTSYEGNFSDVNLFWLPQTSEDLTITMGAENEDIGKVCRLYNSNSIGGHKVTVVLQMWGYSQYTDNQGILETTYDHTYPSIKAAIMPQEIVELTCYSLPPSAYTNNGKTYDKVGKWIITGRFGTDNWKQDDNLGINGRFPRVLAMGRIQGTGNGATIIGTYFDGRSLTDIWSVTRLDTGKYHVYFGGADLPDGYKVMVSGFGWSTDGGGPIKPSLYTENKAYFEVATSDDATLNDGDFDFIMFAPSWEHSM